METTFIYGLLDPKSNKLRYIGKANDPEARLAKHIREAKKSTSLHRLAWIRGLLNEGLIPKLILLMEVSRDQWSLVEKLLIFSLSDAGYDLTNMADGGEGGATARGRKRSQEARNNISQGLKNLYAGNADLRNHQRQNSLKLWENEEFRKKRDVALNDPEVKSRMSEFQKERWEGQEIRNRQSEVGKKNWNDPQLREKMTSAIKEKWKDPEYRERQRQARLKSWANRKAKKVK